MFSKKKYVQFIEQRDIELPDTPVEIYRGIYLLEQENDRLTDKHTKGSTLILLTDKKGNELNRRLIQLPIEQGIETILTNLLIEPTSNKKQRSSKSQMILNDIEEPKIKNKKKTVNYQTVFFLFTTNLAKKIYMALIIVLFLFFTSFFVLNNHSSTSTDSQSYHELLKKKDYEKIIKQYPEKENELVEKLYSEKNSKELKELAEKSDSQIALFYWDFLNEHWQAVTTMKNVTPNEIIQAMRGYAYLKQGKLDEAELINKEIDNQTLKDQIYQFKKQEAYKALHEKDIEKAEKINKEINNSELSEDIKVAKSMVNLLQKYEKDRSDSKLSEDERKEAENNYKLWSENLKQLGGNDNV
ncbi:hypothetical protein ACMDZ0_002610 [Enterococcus hirae]